VTIRVRDTDRYGRTVAEVILPDGRSLNRELVGQGMAWWYKMYAPADRELARLEGPLEYARSYPLPGPIDGQPHHRCPPAQGGHRWGLVAIYGGRARSGPRPGGR
jgi:hypothetical protein